ncbi:amidase family protein [Liquorilactobacillus uvarum]|uniref:amidase family protein n=1 Tax=Liquorilactobacillus uvarum TaxID=303240 RepID=UPI00288921F7|nr:amidase family protein [Liquorilactobacillus uvarum]
MIKNQQAKTTPYIDPGYEQPALEKGKLSNKTFAIKDVFNLKGHTSGLGNPDWKKIHGPAKENAAIVDMLLKQGASLRGVTISDEFMYSIKGVNIHYGTPANPKYPWAFTGGSSSGSASAVAAHDVDFALGTDTGGSVRVPASYCGLYGFRPTHDIQMLEGVAPLAPSFDTVGLLTRSSEMLSQLGDVLYAPVEKRFDDLILLRDAFDLASEDYKEEVLPFIDELSISKKIKKLPTQFELMSLLDTFKAIQGYEAWQNYGDWVSKNKDKIGKDIKAHFDFAEQISKETNVVEKARVNQQEWKAYLTKELKPGQLLLVPTTPDAAPAKTIGIKEMEEVRKNTQLLTTIAGLSGLPQITVPVEKNGYSFGLSFIASQGMDLPLIKFVQNLVNGSK